ncbi:MAG: sulfatase-like hydrolase/transferase, partial [Acidobacteria bacterium]|nr:sulfatase-like hydrolase/transferase [Acidobacteriota bacterium]
GELDWHRGFDSSYDEGYSTDLIADEAVRFIEEQAGGESPFFLYVPFNAPHAPLQVPAKWLDDYASIGDKDRRTYAAMVAAMDAGVGRILEALERTGVTKDTLVWFFSDNGGPGTGDNTPLRAGKGTVYEGGVRVAAALRWPGKVPAGGKVETPLMNIDVWPTLARLAGLDPAKGPGKPLDGVDVWDAVQGKALATRPLYSYYERYQGEALALIEYPWKLVRNGPPILGPNPDDAPPEGMRVRTEKLRVELFRLDEDPRERTDLSAEQPQRVEAMLAKLRSFRALRPAAGVPPMTAPDPPGWKAPREWRMTEE